MLTLTLILLNFPILYCYESINLERTLWGSEFPLWIQAGYDPPAGSSYFGTSTAISKTNLIVGAPATCGYLDSGSSCDQAGSGNGTAYIYGYNVPQNKWILESSLTAPQDAVAFGWAVQIGNNLALISARRTGSSSTDNGFDNGHGSAYMYAYDSTNGWTLVQSFAETGTTNYGNSLSMVSDGSLLAIGAPSRYGGIGAVYIYSSFSASSFPYFQWLLQQKLVSPSGTGLDFGISVSFDLSLYTTSSLSLPRLIVGSPTSDRSFYIFQYISSSSGAQRQWNEVKVTTNGVTPVIGPSNSAYGTNVALSQNYVFVSAPVRNQLYIYQKTLLTGTATYVWTQLQILASTKPSSFALASNSTIVISTSGSTSTSSTAGVYVYIFDGATKKFVQSTFLACSVSDSQGQLPVGMLTYQSQQIIVGGSYGSQVSFFNFTRAPDPTATPTSMPTSRPSFLPTYQPSVTPTSASPSIIPTSRSTYSPSAQPTVPTELPTATPSLSPTLTFSPTTIVTKSISNSVLSYNQYVTSFSIAVSMFGLLLIITVIILILRYYWHQQEKENNIAKAVIYAKSKERHIQFVLVGFQDDDGENRDNATSVVDTQLLHHY